jgi:hypothetical protein
MKHIVHLSANYTVIQNKIFQDNDLSVSARGLFAYLLTLPNDWDFSIRRIAFDCKMGTQLTQKLLRELRNYGVVKIKNVRGDNGIFESEYHFYTEKQKVDATSGENHHWPKVVDF